MREKDTGIRTGDISGGIYNSILAGHDVNIYADHSVEPALIVKSIRRLSEIAARDAGLVSSADPTGLSQEGIQLQNVYVQRSLEETVYAYLAEIVPHNSSFILITGEAGHGKTSLLWHLYHTILAGDKWEPWFIKSTLLSKRSSETLRQHLVLAAQEAKTSIRRPIILLDTVDLLLHDEAERDHLLALLSAIREAGCPIVVTCRLQESRSLNIEKDLSCRLMEYNDEELRHAISKHVARFYERADSRERQEHIERILGAVARGLPLREACTHPLTLRMLFTLYAPKEIPFEIHIFKLYQKYWNNRVQQDRRAGSQTVSNAANLGKTASAIALAMLAEGTPEIESYLLDKALPKFQGTVTEIESLVSRGILNSSEEGTVRFFHQTFFEHSAARGLIDYPHGLRLLEERTEISPNDLFVNPVYEQALLLSEDEIAPVRQQGEEHLQKLLLHESLIAKSSGLYVYAHRRKVREHEIWILQTLLKDGEPAIIDYFLRVAPNIARHRFSTLFQELELIWGRHSWTDQQHILELLERLASQAAKDVIDYLSRHQVLDYVIQQDATRPGVHQLLRVLVSLIPFSAEWSWNGLLQLYIKALPRTKSRELQISILEILGEHAEEFGRKNIASRFEKAIQDYQEDISQYSRNSFICAYGRLWEIEWQASKQTVPAILNEICRCPLNAGFKARLTGFTDILMNATPQEAEFAFSAFLKERDVGKRWAWAHIVWSQVLDGGKVSAEEISAANGPINPVTQYICNQVSQIFTICCDAEGRKSSSIQSDDDSMLCSQLREALLGISPSQELFQELFQAACFNHPETWLDHTSFGRLLAHGFLAQHPGAIQAMNLLIQSSAAYPAKLVRLVGSTGSDLIEHALIADRHVNAFITFILRVKYDTLLLKAIEQISSHTPEILDRWADELDVFRKELLSSRSGNRRRSGVRLWMFLFKSDFISPPALSDLLERLKQENDLMAQAWLFLLLGEAAARDAYDMRDVVGALLPFAKSERENIREKATTALIMAVSQSSADSADFAEDVLEAMLTPPTRAGWLIKFGHILSSLLPFHVDLARTLLQRLLFSPETCSLETRGKRTLINHLRSPVRELVRQASLETLEKLLECVPRLDDVLGRLIIEAVCHESFEEVLPTLEQLLELEEVPGRIKELIRRNKYHRERTLGSEGWPELYEILADRSHP